VHLTVAYWDHNASVDEKALMVEITGISDKLKVMFYV
jgi:hypothetical protein